MHLTGEWFRTLIASVNNRANDDARRSSPRVGVRFAAPIRPLDGTRQLDAAQVHVRDISAKGIGFMHARRMRVGQRFILELPEEEGGPLRILGEVRNVETLAAGVFGIGAQFIQVGFDTAQKKAVATQLTARELDDKAARIREVMFADR